MIVGHVFLDVTGEAGQRPVADERLLVFAVHALAACAMTVGAFLSVDLFARGNGHGRCDRAGDDGGSGSQRRRRQLVVVVLLVLTRAQVAVQRRVRPAETIEGVVLRRYIGI